MTTTKKPRVFTLHLLDGYFVEGAVLPTTKNTISTIDYEAYEQLQAEIATLKKKLELCKQQRDDAMKVVGKRVGYSDKAIIERCAELDAELDAIKE